MQHVRPKLTYDLVKSETNQAEYIYLLAHKTRVMPQICWLVVTENAGVDEKYAEDCS